MSNFPLQIGYQGREATALQNALNNQYTDDSGNYMFNLTVTGVIDKPTVDAINKLNVFLSNNGYAIVHFPLQAEDYLAIVGDEPDYTTPKSSKVAIMDVADIFENMFSLEAPQMPPGYTDPGYSAHRIFLKVHADDPSISDWIIDVPGLGIYEDTGTGHDVGARVFSRIFNDINPWLEKNGYKGAGKVSDLQRKYGMTGAWENSSDPLYSVNTYIEFMRDLIAGGAKLKAGAGDSKLKAIGKGIKKDLKKVGDIAKKVIAAAAKALKDIGEDVVFAPLLPFKKSMKKKIAEAGLHTDGSMADIILKTGEALGAHKHHLDGVLHIDGDIPAPEPGIDKTDKNYADMLSQVATGLTQNDISGGRVIPAPPVPQIIVTAVTAATSLVGIPPAAALPIAQAIWGFLHKEKHTPGSDVNKAITDMQDAHMKDERNEDEVGGEVKIGHFKIKAKVFAPAAFGLLIIIIIGIAVFKKK